MELASLSATRSFPLDAVCSKAMKRIGYVLFPAGKPHLRHRISDTKRPPDPLAPGGAEKPFSVVVQQLGVAGERPVFRGGEAFRLIRFFPHGCHIPEDGILIEMCIRDRCAGYRRRGQPVGAVPL